MSPGIQASPYRLPEQTRLGAVSLLVRDLERSLSYYQQVIGLALLSREGERATLGAPGSTAPLLHLRGGATAKTVRRVERLGLYHFAILVPDRAALGRTLNHLADVGVPVVSSDHAVSEALYLWDPDGLGIEIYADRPRHSWRMNGDELFMTSEPLDLRGVIAASAGQPWSGLPSGTVLGHMHLHVADLGEAERFYHHAVGLDKTVWSYPGALFLSAGGYHHHLGTNTWAGAVPPRGEDEPGLLEWEVVVPSAADARACAEHCASSGYGVSENGPADFCLGVRHHSDPCVRLRTGN